jgi:hypothetical protein
MANNGKTSGDGKTSPFGSPSGERGKSAGGNDFIKNPAGTNPGTGNDFIANPAGNGDKSGGVDLVANPGGSMAVPEQKKGSYARPDTIPQGGKLPMVKGGTEPPATRTDPKKGFGGAHGGPSNPGSKPYKVK